MEKFEQMQTMFDYFLCEQLIFERKMFDVIWKQMTPSD